MAENSKPDLHHSFRKLRKEVSDAYYSTAFFPRFYSNYVNAVGSLIIGVADEIGPDISNIVKVIFFASHPLSKIYSTPKSLRSAEDKFLEDKNNADIVDKFKNHPMVEHYKSDINRLDNLDSLTSKYVFQETLKSCGRAAIISGVFYGIGRGIGYFLK